MRKPSPALIISLIALFVALSGTSYAVSKLPKNSVGEKQLKKNAVTSKKVKDRSLLATDFKTGQLPSGANGANGAKGDTGATGATGPLGPSTAGFGQGNAGIDLNNATFTAVATMPVSPSGGNPGAMVLLTDSTNVLVHSGVPLINSVAAVVGVTCRLEVSVNGAAFDPLVGGSAVVDIAAGPARDDTLALVAGTKLNAGTHRFRTACISTTATGVTSEQADVTAIAAG